ncbi:MAG TPA: choice-of-anchor P family protein [Rhizomicrobium sp.]|jgi:hypothetical protein|nr:choice-of-anchor P family protein [Rhizomicrobium sp.]
MNRFSSGATWMALTAFCVGVPASAWANDAFGIRAGIFSETVLSHFGPIGQVSHKNNGAYDKSTSVAHVNEVNPIATGTLPPYFFIEAKGLSSEVKDNGIAVDTTSTSSSNSVAHAKLTININPPPGMAVPIPYPALLVQASGLSTQANFTTIVTGPNTAASSSSIGSLRIMGTLFSSPVVYSGSAPPNTVIYDGPHVTVTLNKVAEEGTLVCTPDCALKPSSIAVEAVNIRLRNASIDGHTINGDIVLSRAAAQ